MDQVHLNPDVRHEAVILEEVINSNPNGDPDNGGAPRQDPDTEHGYITDVARKRRVRDHIALVGPDMAARIGQPWDPASAEIYISNGRYLNDRHAEARAAVGDDVRAAQQWMCRRYYDVRSLGMMGSTSTSVGNVRGPWQFSFLASVDPITVIPHRLTRCANTTAEDAAKVGTMATKSVVPYALYRGHVYYNPYRGHSTGISVADMAAMWDALEYAWETTRAAGRAEVQTRLLYIYSHSTRGGYGHAHELLGRVRASRRPDVEYPRALADYAITLDESPLPRGVTLTRLVAPPLHD